MLQLTQKRPESKQEGKFDKINFSDDGEDAFDNRQNDGALGFYSLAQSKFIGTGGEVSRL